MPRTKEQYQEIREQKKMLIKQTALSLFAQEGYEQTSIQHIAQKAGISKGLMYNYFASKEELLHVIMEELSKEFESMIDPNHDGFVTDEEAADFIDMMFDMLRNRKEEMKLFYQVSFQPKVMDFILERFDSPYTVKIQQLLAGFAARKLDCKNELAAYFSLTAFLKGLAMVYIYTEERFPVEFTEEYKKFLKDKFCK